mmetsp:Transcript_95568/g.248867  ORF Transcript_95568/g.248867 Transcript_95568/m.248867 type:complete len:244 (-) Transcript_95568:379-1110(-)
MKDLPGLLLTSRASSSILRSSSCSAWTFLNVSSRACSCTRASALLRASCRKSSSSWRFLMCRASSLLFGLSISEPSAEGCSSSSSAADRSRLASQGAPEDLALGEGCESVGLLGDCRDVADCVARCSSSCKWCKACSCSWRRRSRSRWSLSQLRRSSSHSSRASCSSCSFSWMRSSRDSASARLAAWSSRSGEWSASPWKNDLAVSVRDGMVRISRRPPGEFTDATSAACCCASCSCSCSCWI